jgi:hypothetical protein
MEPCPLRPTEAGATRDGSQPAPDASAPASYVVVCRVLASSWSLGGQRRHSQPTQEDRPGPQRRFGDRYASGFNARNPRHPFDTRRLATANAKGPGGQRGQSKARAAPRREANRPLWAKASLRRTANRGRAAGGRSDYPPIENSGMPHSFSGNKRPQQAAPRATATVGSSGT